MIRLVDLAEFARTQPALALGLAAAAVAVGAAAVPLLIAAAVASLPVAVPAGFLAMVGAAAGWLPSWASPCPAYGLCAAMPATNTCSMRGWLHVVWCAGWRPRRGLSDGQACGDLQRQ